MRSYPEDEDDFKELKKIKAPEWMLEILKKNPDYVYWGNHEDYMCNKSGGWNSPVELESVEDLFELDELNELVNFYFFIHRDNKQCVCEGTGLNKQTKQLSDDWYDFDRTGRKWSNKLTDEDVKELVKQGRLWDYTDKRYEFNEETQKWSFYDEKERKFTDMEGEPKFPNATYINEKVFHDAINQHICVKARATRLGFYGLCEECDGDGYVYTEEYPHLALQMWFLHPRKGASRGVLLKNIEQHELDKVYQYLREAKERNNERFSKI